jgi:hypothetical protein
VGLLPSQFISESAPSSVIEYLACGKPVIATARGSVPDMLAWDGIRAGVLVPIELPSIDMTTALRDAMLSYMTSDALLQQHSRYARQVFNARFNIESVASEYASFLALPSPQTPGSPGAAVSEMSIERDIDGIRRRVLELGNHSHTSLTFQDDILAFVKQHADRGTWVVEVGCYRGGLTAQLAYLCRELGKSLHVVDINEDYLGIARQSVRTVTDDSHVEYYCGEFQGFVSKRLVSGPAILTVIDADHRYDAVRRDIAALYLLNPPPYAVAFHDFSLRYTTSELQEVRVDQAIVDFFGAAVQYRELGEIAGVGPTLATSPGEDGHYHQQGSPEGVLLLCGEDAAQGLGSEVAS